MKARPRIHSRHLIKVLWIAYKSVINVFRRKPLLGAPEMNVLWKLVSGKTNLQQESFEIRYMKHQVFPIIGTIITKRKGVALWQIFFDEVYKDAFLHVTFNCHVALRPRFHAYVVSVYVGAPEPIVFQMADVSITYWRRKFTCLKAVQQLDNFTIRELCCPLENYLRIF